MNKPKTISELMTVLEVFYTEEEILSMNASELISNYNRYFAAFDKDRISIEDLQ